MRKRFEFAKRLQEFHHQASQAAGGLSDFGSDEYLEPLGILLADYDTYGEFSDEGAATVSNAVVGNLVSRLHEAQGFKQYPEFAESEIRQPVFIIGMPRTGTTMLHRLVDLDHSLQSMPLWLSASPMPRPPRDTWEGFPAFQQIRRELDQLYEANPSIRLMHPQAPEKADECHLLMSHSFWSWGVLSYCFTNVPNYQEWVFHKPADPAYQRYKRTLALMAGGDPRPWLLKDPCHIFGLEALLHTFPDARLVFTHRDPVDSFLSFADLVCANRSAVEPSFTPARLRGQFPGYWGRALDRLSEILSELDESRYVDLHLSEISSDPVGSVARIYSHFGMVALEETRRSWSEQVAEDPTGGHQAGGGTRFELADFGMSDASILKSLGRYAERYAAIASRLDPGAE